MECCVSNWGDMRTAELTRINLVINDTIMVSNFLAFTLENVLKLE